MVAKATAADQLAAHRSALEELRVLTDDQDAAEAHQEDHVEEVGDEAGSVQHRLARLLGVGDGEEAHQDVWQAGGAEHQAEAQRDGGHRVGQQAARIHQLGTELMHGRRFLQQALVRKPELAEGQDHDQRTPGEQHAGLDDLYPGRRDHAAEGDINHHQQAYGEDGDVVVEAEEQLDQLARADHLRQQVEADHGQRRDRGHGPHLALVEAVGGDVGEGELAEVAQAFGHQEQDDRPAGEEGQHVDVAIVALGVHHRRQAEERRRRHVVAGDRQAVLEAGNAAAGGIEVGGRLGPAGRPVGDPHGQSHEDQEHDDGVPVGRLLLGRADGVGGEGKRGKAEQRERGDDLPHYLFSFHASRMRSWVIASNSLFARMT
jgi:hypothetical protein